MAAAEDEDEKRRSNELANEMANACNALGRELSRLAGFVQWADTVVCNAEAAAGMAMDGRTGPTKCFAQYAERAPECYYIGDGIVAQLLADAEAAAASAACQ